MLWSRLILPIPCNSCTDFRVIRLGLLHNEDLKTPHIFHKDTPFQLSTSLGQGHWDLCWFYAIPFIALQNLQIWTETIINMHSPSRSTNDALRGFGPALPLAMSSNTEPVPCCGRSARCLAAPWHHPDTCELVHVQNSRWNGWQVASTSSMNRTHKDQWPKINIDKLSFKRRAWHVLAHFLERCHNMWLSCDNWGQYAPWLLRSPGISCRWSLSMLPAGIIRRN